MGKGGGGSTEVKETSQQAAAADVARQQWDLYQNELKPYENLFMDKVEGLNDQQKYDGIAGDVNLGYQQEFGKARRQAADGLASAGVDPSSGKFQSTLKDVATDQVAGTIDATNRSQTDQQNKYVAGLHDIQAMGAGQKAEAMQGYQGIAAASQQKAISDAQSSLSKQQSTKGLVGAVGGALASYGLSSMNTASPAATTSSSSNGVFGSSGGLGLSTNWKSYT
ncbi:hypothetical protein EXT51_03180 [Pectobacterium carotovorum subsp. carotovorum]|uniref:Uncharacterized protein n=1 Tax=Pectobacterium brasiliense TaxID=180957 RepID=A0A0M2F2I7_9GAMM|nr:MULTISPECIES: hypothetical protein [Pectobacterium]KGA34229.1 hypothetical protein KU74_12180 [Pectobacterium brasiliense]MCL6328505.1 hypothetical protein [Pectobacterium carotovorum subsp. carotovorum]